MDADEIRRLLDEHPEWFDGALRIERIRPGEEGCRDLSVPPEDPEMLATIRRYLVLEAHLGELSEMIEFLARGEDLTELDLEDVDL